jgi:hypothetical protein
LVGGQVINNFGARVANCTASTFPTCSYTTANEVLYQISEVTPDFAIAITPGAEAVMPGVTGTYTVTITPIGGFTGNVTFGVTGQPADAPTFDPSVVNTQGTTIMSVPTNIGTPSGVSTLIVTGTSGALQHTSTVYLAVLLQKPRFISRKIIDLIDNTPGLDIPIRSKTGKIPFSYTLQEHPTVFTFNNQWVVQTQMVGVSSPSLVDYAPVYPPAPPAGSPATVALPAYVQPIVDSSIPNPSAVTVGTPVANQGWFYTDSGYVSHFFNVQGTVGATVSTDGSGYTLTANASTTLLCKTAPCPTVVDVSGNVLANNNNVDPLFRGNVATFTDPSGVKLTAFFAGDAYQSVIYTDTMNQVVLTAAETNASSVPPTGPLPTNQYSYADASGKVQRYTVFYQLFYQSTNFGCPGVTEMPRTPVYLPITVTQPDGTFYAITYEIMSGGDTTGRIASVRGPTGGLTRYSYNGVNCADGSTNTLVTTTPDGGSWTSVHTLN